MTFTFGAKASYDEYFFTPESDYKLIANNENARLATRLNDKRKMAETEKQLKRILS